MFNPHLAAAGEHECDYATADEIRDYWLARCREVIEANVAAEVERLRMVRHGVA